MITLEATIICDTCKQIICGGEPQTKRQSDSAWIWAIASAEAKAMNLGAHIGIATTECADCHAKSTTTTPTVWVIEESK